MVKFPTIMISSLNIKLFFQLFLRIYFNFFIEVLQFVRCCVLNLGLTIKFELGWQRHLYKFELSRIFEVFEY